MSACDQGPRTASIAAGSAADGSAAGWSAVGWSAADQADYEEGWGLYEARRFFEAHEAWERAWRRCGEPQRRFVQALILLTAACHLLFDKRRRSGGIKNLDKAARALAEVPDGFLGEDVPALRGAIAELRAEAARADAASDAEIGAEIDGARVPRRPLSACAR
ncbi:MAG: DUF309 domain-containing protein [Polyangia bacterium]